MSFFFWRRATDPPDQLLRDIDSRFRRIEDSLVRLSERIAENAPSTHVTVEQVHIHQPVLERLEFRLDELDIEHLSGSLNLGNNFGVKTNPKPPVKSGVSPSSNQGSSAGCTESHTRTSEQHSVGGDPDLERTASGFRLRRS
ncbi:hypothetical protein [Paenibacillus tyrfis]|uniref:hypothetical protein n=1 Tax=Paenibacillus tyrfis TaxID=1501230 RepID=UPI00068984FC|nr:hypothetical protein [Paenibacillus tyrfis]